MSLVGSWRVWVVVSADEATKMANTNQFFNLVLECFAFVCGMAIVTDSGSIWSYLRWEDWIFCEVVE